MSLDPVKYGNLSENELTVQINREERLSPSEMSNIFQGLYIQYSKEGEVPGVLISAGGVDSILNGAFLSDNTPSTVTDLANKICDYWASFVTPGVAQILDVVILVVVNSTAQKAGLIQKINSYIEDGNGWVGFYEAVEEIVKTIPFSVTELNSATGVTQVFVRTLS